MPGPQGGSDSTASGPAGGAPPGPKARPQGAAGMAITNQSLVTIAARDIFSDASDTDRGRISENTDGPESRPSPPRRPFNGSRSHSESLPHSTGPGRHCASSSAGGPRRPARAGGAGGSQAVGPWPSGWMRRPGTAAHRDWHVTVTGNSGDGTPAARARPLAALSDSVRPACVRPLR